MAEFLLSNHVVQWALVSPSVARPVSIVVGTLYPVYNSFKILENPFTPAKGTSAEEKRPRYWLTYWTVYGLWNVVESVADSFFSNVPFYFQFKIAFFLWMQLPQFNGAKVVYHKFIAPFLRKHEAQVDRVIDVTHNEMSSFVEDKQEELQRIANGVKKLTETISMHKELSG